MSISPAASRALQKGRRESLLLACRKPKPLRRGTVGICPAMLPKRKLHERKPCAGKAQGNVCSLEKKGCVIENGWCFFPWNSKGITNKISQSQSPLVENFEKTYSFSILLKQNSHVLWQSQKKRLASRKKEEKKREEKGACPLFWGRGTFQPPSPKQP